MVQMGCETESVVLLCSDKNRSPSIQNDYNVDLYVELKKYWMVVGVLVSVALSVLAPHVGAPGGILHTQYLWYIPLCYVWYCAGRRGAALPPLRALLATAAHASVVVPALRLLLPSLGLDALPPIGVGSSTVEGGWSWLAIALCEDEAAAAVIVVAYIAVLVTTPLATLALCGRAALPAAGAALGAGVPAAAAWGAGVLQGGGGEGVGARVAALALLYVQCCGALGARGPAAVGDVAATLGAEACWAAAGAGLCGAYVWCGSRRSASLAVLCAVPRGLEAGGAWCGAGGGALGAALRGPAAALLLSALAPHQPRRERPTPPQTLTY